MGRQSMLSIGSSAYELNPKAFNQIEEGLSGYGQLDMRRESPVFLIDRKLPTTAVRSQCAHKWECRLQAFILSPQIRDLYQLLPEACGDSLNPLHTEQQLIGNQNQVLLKGFIKKKSMQCICQGRFTLTGDKSLHLLEKCWYPLEWCNQSKNPP